MDYIICSIIAYYLIDNVFCLNFCKTVSESMIQQKSNASALLCYYGLLSAIEELFARLADLGNDPLDSAFGAVFFLGNFFARAVIQIVHFAYAPSAFVQRFHKLIDGNSVNTVEFRYGSHFG